MTLIGYIIIGLIGGSIAKAIMPGEEGGGWVATAALGAFGAVLAGWLGQLVFDSSYQGIFSIRGLIFSVVGAVIILTVQGWLKKRKA
ncbi:GlsB/YeaQ/YmgE family stress response membrane protein [[Pseudopropionibacterium] massiliense]|uniref:GlsB/YeaQ/YmgE family stress response membrane protein n=1 Tax=[Pseudopropionibacterium] massiliense TaxID=2220000 RepID=UPI00102F61EA|nr:GlsB/YeaQ/YmgE family stress response membrane protein [[Pseudopropionibacterium] massiliense]